MAADTADALREEDRDSVRLAYDISRYTGPVLHPISPNENIAPVTALMVNEGRLDDTDRGTAERSEDPAGDAARTFAAALKKAGVKVSGAPARPARPTGPAPSPPTAPPRSTPSSSAPSPTATTTSPRPSPGRPPSPRARAPRSPGPAAPSPTS